jgi:hypothetical protein
MRISSQKRSPTIVWTVDGAMLRDTPGRLVAVAVGIVVSVSVGVDV